MSEEKITYYEGPRILLDINGARHRLLGYWPELGIIHVDGNGKRYVDPMLTLKGVDGSHTRRMRKWCLDVSLNEVGEGGGL